KSEPPKDQQVDTAGDPLPRLAIARLGTSRWRLPLTIATLAFSDDGNNVIATGALGEGCCLWETSSGKSQVWSPDYEGVEAAVVLPDGKTMMTCNITRPNPTKVRRHLKSWEIGTGR